MMLRPKTWLAAARAAAGYSAPLLPFASFPAALTVEGQVRRPEELPGVELIAVNGIWRPRGGRQVLAMRANNPVTVQDTTLTNGILAEEIGPFPGGLVRAGMKLSLSQAMSAAAITATARVARAFIGNTGSPLSTGSMGYEEPRDSSANMPIEMVSELTALSDTVGPHIAPPLNITSATFRAKASHGYSSNLARQTVSVDFSLDWLISIYLRSAAETAITITGATWSDGVATYTTSAPHTLAVGDKDVISGITPSGYNGTFIVSAVGSPTMFSVPKASDPGAWVSGPGSSSRISNMISQSYVLELIG